MRYYVLSISSSIFTHYAWSTMAQDRRIIKRSIDECFVVRLINVWKIAIGESSMHWYHQDQCDEYRIQSSFVNHHMLFQAPSHIAFDWWFIWIIPLHSCMNRARYLCDYGSCHNSFLVLWCTSTKTACFALIIQFNKSYLLSRWSSIVDRLFRIVIRCIIHEWSHHT